MKEAQGDLWKYARENGTDAICVLTNMTVSKSRLIMGGGQAREARELFPALPSLWGEEYERRQRDGIMLGLIVFDPMPSTPALVSFPTKYHPSDSSDLALISQSARELVHAADEKQWENVLLGRPGCGLGGLKWEEDVKPLLETLFDDRFTVITL